MKLIIDDREQAIISQMDGSHEIGHLILGDFHIVSADKTMIHAILERKTIDDLRASLKDHRYHEQKSRLLEYHRLNNSVTIGYIIEGDLTKEPILEGMILRAMIRDHFLILNSKNTSDTVTIITKLLGTFNHPKCFDTRKNDLPQQAELPSKKQITKDTYFKYSLALIPQMSIKKADAIIKSGISSFVDLKELSEQEISDIKVGKRRIGGQLAKKIISFINQC